MHSTAGRKSSKRRELVMVGGSEDFSYYARRSWGLGAMVTGFKFQSASLVRVFTESKLTEKQGGLRGDDSATFRV